VSEVGDPRLQRAADADREAVAEVLRRAAGDGRLTLDELHERLDSTYSAKTYGELELIVSDLPVALPPAVRPPSDPVPRPAGTVARIGGVPTSRSAVAVFGGAERKGLWVVPESFTAFALFGGIDLDLREARFERREVRLQLTAVFGGIDVVVPEDVEVHVDGAGIFGGFGQPEAPVGGVAPGGPVIRITGLALFGGVDVKRRAPGAKR
jgi:Domain of unknown function (DUF1707)/Cell wall-active antibiotics response 4TMS YvqF